MRQLAEWWPQRFQRTSSSTASFFYLHPVNLASSPPLKISLKTAQNMCRQNYLHKALQGLVKTGSNWGLFKKLWITKPSGGVCYQCAPACSRHVPLFPELCRSGASLRPPLNLAVFVSNTNSAMWCSLCMCGCVACSSVAHSTQPAMLNQVEIRVSSTSAIKNISHYVTVFVAD